MSTELKKILVAVGAGLNVPAERESAVYDGYLEDIHQGLAVTAGDLNAEVNVMQFNGENAIIKCLQNASGRYAGVIINTEAWGNDSDALCSAVGAVSLPCVAVFTADKHVCESAGHLSADGVISGFGVQGYSLALQALMHLLEKQ